ncbi:thiol-disulfide oxidoreductase DCC family protein [Seonamhaeicola marinus]|uniref:Thiol-disulfide oxidoreductase DCC family protein n=1 Tax=Seonamhaeicola marinus TaxID=1912246 RepID=A0A5D0I6V6_9FLAO|nr:thiol-disulfide oxidoreductase DCC family protein [Seonamhaeicola marinus]TYA78669.1 thiol-disulfide oxidoreductase DCC family protein [Seonamhaeicola marinus]
MNNIPANKKLILFDGVCNLCNSSVQYVIKHDRKDLFLFAPLQSSIGQELIKKYDLDTKVIDSVLLYTPEKGIVYKSTAALAIAKHLGFPRNLLSVFYIIPAFIRNIVYDFIAKNRYKWYGQKEACMIPTPELKNRFLG